MRVQIAEEAAERQQLLHAEELKRTLLQQAEAREERERQEKKAEDERQRAERRAAEERERAEKKELLLLQESRDERERKDLLAAQERERLQNFQHAIAVKMANAQTAANAMAGSIHAPRPNEIEHVLLNPAEQIVLKWLRDNKIVPNVEGAFDAIAIALVSKHWCTSGDDVLRLGEQTWQEAGFPPLAIGKLKVAACNIQK